MPKPTLITGPTFDEMLRPDTTPPDIRRRALAAAKTDPLDPINLFNITWRDENNRIYYHVIPRELTGVDATIVVLYSTACTNFPTGSHKVGAAYSVLLEGRERRMAPLPAKALAAEPAGAADWLVLSPMMGIVKEIYASMGDFVKEGDILMVIEAMKMNNDLKARRSGRVQRVYVSPGERVEQGRALLLLA